MMIYYNAQARVKVEGNLSDPFDLGVGVLQGDTLAPFLFIIVIDWVLRNAIPTEDLPFLGFQLTKPEGTKTRPTSEAKYLTDLDYCDDISLISATLEGAQQLLLNVEKWALKVGLKINVPKTEFLAIGNWNTELNSPSGLNLCMSDGTRLNLVKNFRYLGSWIRDSTPDFKARAAQSWTAVKKLRRLWTSKILDNDVRKKFFYFLVVPISSYGSTAWTINKTLQNRIDSSFRRMYRYAQNIKWTEHIKNKDVFVNVTPASKLIARHRLRFIGHCWRSRLSAPQPVSDLLFWDAKSMGFKMKPGRRSNFRKLLLQETQCVDVQALKDLMDDRDAWIKHCDTIYPYADPFKDIKRKKTSRSQEIS